MGSTRKDWGVTTAALTDTTASYLQIVGTCLPLLFGKTGGRVACGGLAGCSRVSLIGLTFCWLVAV